MNETLVVVIVVLGLVFFGLTFLLSLAILHGTHTLAENFSVFKLRQENIYEKCYKMDSTLQSITQNLMADSILSSMPDQSGPSRAIRTPNGMIIASSLEEFIHKVSQDPNFKGISKEQIDELRKLFEDNFNNSDDEDESNES